MRILMLPTLFLLIAAGDGASVTVEHPWARPSVSSNGAAYLTITEQGAADRLVSVSSPAAAMVQLHETVNEGGVMKMRPVEGLDLAPGKPVMLSPGGYHVMMMGLKAPLKLGASFPLTLTFAHAAPVTVTVKVEAPKPAAGGGAMDHMGH